MKKPILTVIKRAIVQELFKVDKTPLEILKEVPDITALKLESFFYPLGILTEDAVTLEESRYVLPIVLCIRM